MIITNQFNLPQTLVDACKRDHTLQPNEYRVTSLLNGIREILLTRRHDHEIEVDVSEMIWAIFGRAVHSIFERQASPDYFKEERLYCEFGDYTLSGQFDEYHIDGMELNDFKVSSIYKVKLGEFDDWRKQQLIYAYLLMRHSIPVCRGKVTALLRDWTPYKARQDKDCPPLQVYIKEFAFNEQDIHDIEAFIEITFAEIDRWKNEPDDSLPVCTPEQRWYRDEKYAVMKEGNKRASRLCESEQDAEKWIEENGKKGNKYRVDLRPGDNIKCMDYCKARQFCSFYHENVADKAMETESAVPF